MIGHVAFSPSDRLALAGRYSTNVGVLAALSELAGRTPVSPHLTEDTGVILLWGQSNAADHGAGLYAFASSKVDNLCIENGGVYRAKEPLLGNTFLPSDPTNGGCYVSRLADKLIAQGYCDRVILVPVSIGGTFIAQWADGGDCNERLRVAVRRAAALGLSIDVVLVTQGENDFYTATPESYAASMASAIQSLRDEGCDAPVVITLTSLPGSAADNVLSGQIAACDGVSVVQGPATNGFSRRDGIHFDVAGLEAVANALVPYVSPLLN